MRRTPFAFAFVALPLVLLAGCGGGPAATPVDGTLSFSSKKPTGNLLLQFHPVDGASGRKPLSGSATTDEAGKFRVKADDGQDGLPPGKYVVTVVDANLNSDEEPTPGGRRPVNRVAAKYTSADPKANPLQVAVEAGKGGYELKLD